MGWHTGPVINGVSTAGMVGVNLLFIINDFLDEGT